MEPCSCPLTDLSCENLVPSGNRHSHSCGGRGGERQVMNEWGRGGGEMEGSGGEREGWRETGDE